jgi:hypothetical protein
MRKMNGAGLIEWTQWRRAGIFAGKYTGDTRARQSGRRTRTPESILAGFP